MITDEGKHLINLQQGLTMIIYHCDALRNRPGFIASLNDGSAFNATAENLNVDIVHYPLMLAQLGSIPFKDMKLPALEGYRKGTKIGETYFPEDTDPGKYVLDRLNAWYGKNVEYGKVPKWMPLSGDNGMLIG